MSEITVSPISRRRFLGTGSVLALTTPQYSRMAPGGPGRRERLLLGIDDHLLPSALARVLRGWQRSDLSGGGASLDSDMAQGEASLHLHLVGRGTFTLLD